MKSSIWVPSRRYCYGLLLNIAMTLVNLSTDMFYTYAFSKIKTGKMSIIFLAMTEVTWVIFFFHIFLLPTCTYIFLKISGEYLRHTFKKNGFLHPQSNRSGSEDINDSSIDMVLNMHESSSLEIGKESNRLENRNRKGTKQSDATTDQLKFQLQTTGTEHHVHRFVSRSCELERRCSPTKLSDLELKSLEWAVLYCDVFDHLVMSANGLGLLCQTIIHSTDVTFLTHNIISQFMNGTCWVAMISSASYTAMSLGYLWSMNFPADDYNDIVSFTKLARVMF